MWKFASLSVFINRVLNASLFNFHMYFVRKDFTNMFRQSVSCHYNQWLRISLVIIQLHTKYCDVNVSVLIKKWQICVLYGCANGNASTAEHLYADKFANRRVPSHTLFKNLHQCHCESGSFGTCHRDSDRSRSVAMPNCILRYLRIRSIPYPTSASTYSTRLLSESRIFAMAIRKMCIESVFRSLHFIYWWSCIYVKWNYKCPQ